MRFAVLGGGVRMPDQVQLAQAQTSLVQNRPFQATTTDEAAQAPARAYVAPIRPRKQDRN